MPVKHLAVRILEIPIPFDLLPHLGGFAANLGLHGVVRVVEVLADGQHTLYQVCGLYEVSAVVIGAKGLSLAGGAVYPVREGAMVTDCLLIEEGQDFQDAVGGLSAGDESPLGADAYRHQAHTRAAGGAGVGAVTEFVSFPCQSADRMGVIPEVPEEGLLHGSQELLIRHSIRGC